MNFLGMKWLCRNLTDFLDPLIKHSLSKCHKNYPLCEVFMVGLFSAIIDGDLIVVSFCHKLVILVVFLSRIPF